jgi:hypothetical protein
VTFCRTERPGVADVSYAGGGNDIRWLATGTARGVRHLAPSARPTAVYLKNSINAPVADVTIPFDKLATFSGG